MDRWPVGETNQADAQTKKTQRKGKGKAFSWAYPVLEHGALSAATLQQGAGRLEWSFLAGSSKARRLVPQGSPLQIFPDTRPSLPRNVGETILQRAEQGARFLRTHYPEVDIPAEIIREEIAEDARHMHELNEFDPYQGSNIEALHVSRESRESLAYLACPMGESFCDLNISYINFSQREYAHLNAMAKPVRSFPTPIRQLVASTPPSQMSLLGVRTLASASVLKVTAPSVRAVKTDELVQVVRTDVGDKRVVDMILPATRRTLSLMINDVGAVYRCSAPHGDKFLELMHRPPTPLNGPVDNVWRLAHWSSEDDCLLMSSRSADMLDFKSQASRNIYDASRGGELLISIEGMEDDHMVRLLTTSEILWIDERNTRRPLLGIKHGRDLDRTLTAHTGYLHNAPITFLTSFHNGLISLYDVSRTDSNFIQQTRPAYSLPALQATDGRNLGHVFFQHYTDAIGSNISAFQLSETGGLHMLALQLALDDDCVEDRMTGRRSTNILPEESQSLVNHFKLSSAENGPLAARGYSEVDVRPIYDRLFCDDSSETKENGDAVYDLLDKMPTFWQDLDVPLEHMVTTYDVAYRSGGEPANASRNDVFTENVLNSRRGFRALVQDRIPVKPVARGAAWHINISPFIRREVPDLGHEHEETIEHLRHYDLDSDVERPGPSYRRESEAREQLVLDLALASDVFSPVRPQAAADPGLDDALETMSRATEAMSLKDSEPPPVKFGFLRPISKGSIDYYMDSRKQDAARTDGLCPPGVHLLLQEWGVGADPYAYNYEDPYQDGVTKLMPAGAHHPRRRSMDDMPSATQPSTQPRMPPAVVPAAAVMPPVIMASQPTGPRGLAVITQAQCAVSNQQHMLNGHSQPIDDVLGSSQDFPSQLPMPSTQVLPGPHGGRPGPIKKKAVKKRVGGF